MLDGKDAEYTVPLPAAGEGKRGILDTYTKEHSAEYQSQAPIDLAFRLRSQISSLDDIESIVLHTSHHTHYVIGTGANDPQKFDPDASRETLDHSVMYIFAVALEDGVWDYNTSYSPDRAHTASTIELWNKISTVEDPEWTRRYHSNDPQVKAFGAKAVVTLKDGTVIEDELAVANAHPLGEPPFDRSQYEGKFRKLADGLVAEKEQERFLEAARNAASLGADELDQLTVTFDPEVLAKAPTIPEGIL